MLRFRYPSGPQTASFALRLRQIDSATPSLPHMPTLNRIGKDAVVKHHQQVPFHLLRDLPDLAIGRPGKIAK